MRIRDWSSDVCSSDLTVERAVAPLRRELRAEARATVRFETPPGRQLQIDFGETRASIGGESVRLYLFVATLGYSRRGFVQAFRNERQDRKSGWEGKSVSVRLDPGGGRYIKIINR